jgi:hypothetical protein
MRDQRHGADAEHLRQRHHQHHRVAAGADAGHRSAPMRDTEIQVDQEVQRLHQHADRDRRGHGDDQAADRALVRSFMEADCRDGGPWRQP